MTEESQNKPNRFAELALELFGTKAANEFVRDAWDSASAEAKRDLANAVLERVRTDLAGDSSDWRWRINDLLSAHFGRIAGEAVDVALQGAQGDAIRARIKATAEKEIQAGVERAIRDRVDAAVRKAIDFIRGDLR